MQKLISSVFPKSLSFINVIIFFYFFTLHADRLNFKFSIFSFRLNNIIAVFLFIILALKYQVKLFVMDKKLFYGLMFLFFSIFVSTCISANIYRSVGDFLLYNFTVIFYALLPYSLIMNENEEEVLKIYFFSFIIVGIYALTQLGLSFVGVFDPFASQQQGDFIRPNAFAYEASFYALYFSPFMVIINLLFIKRKLYPLSGQGIKNLFIIIITNLLFLISTSSGAFFAYFILILVLLILSLFSNVKMTFPEIKRTLFRFILATSLLTLMMVYVFDNIAKEFFFKFFYTSFFSHHSFLERWFQIKNYWHVFLEHPFFGKGIGGVSQYLFDQYYQSNKEILLRDSVEENFTALQAFGSMNVVTEILASLGIIGFIAFLYLFFIYFKTYKKLVKNIQIENTVKELGFVFLVSIIVMLITLQFSQGLFRTYIWVHFFITFGYINKKIKLV